jgi:hypothetical protein
MRVLRARFGLANALNDVMITICCPLELLREVWLEDLPH